MYSGHDFTILYLTAALNLTSAECIYDLFMYNTTTANSCISRFPVFASNLLIELYADEALQHDLV